MYMASVSSSPGSDLSVLVIKQSMCVCCELFSCVIHKNSRVYLPDVLYMQSSLLNTIQTCNIVLVVVFVCIFKVMFSIEYFNRYDAIPILLFRYIR